MTNPERADAKSMSEVISDLWELVRTYFKQETVDPLKALGTFFKFGLGGALLAGTGTILVSLGVLRALQTETDTAMTGNLSWIPYLITFAFTVIVIALSVSRVSKSRRT